jgi:hypothetical protein
MGLWDNGARHLLVDQPVIGQHVEEIGSFDGELIVYFRLASKLGSTALFCNRGIVECHNVTIVGVEGLVLPSQGDRRWNVEQGPYQRSTLITWGNVLVLFSGMPLKEMRCFMH